jgi:hypothetical protein|tara:strand:- start:994 stop:1320 length:327 start_codon:yes stop_codon:yes gene_type:complete
MPQLMGVGETVGLVVPSSLVGVFVGVLVCAFVGALVGDAVDATRCGADVGVLLGACVGASVAALIGALVGDAVDGTTIGADVGNGVGGVQHVAEPNAGTEMLEYVTAP